MSWFKLWYDSTHALDTRTQGWTVSGSETFAAPEADVEEITVPGRNGTVIIPRGRWNNVERTFSVFLPQFEAGLATLKNYALQCANGYFMLEDEQSDAAGVFYMARVKSIEVDSTGPYFGTGVVNVVFDCQPQRFLLAGMRWATYAAGNVGDLILWADATNLTVWNREAEPAEMAIMVHGYGEFGWYPVGNPNALKDWEVTEYPSEYGNFVLDAMSKTVYFTESAQNAWDYVRNQGSATSDTWPVIQGGGNHGFYIARGSYTLTEIEVLPRWWRL